MVMQSLETRTMEGQLAYAMQVRRAGTMNRPKRVARDHTARAALEARGFALVTAQDRDAFDWERYASDGQARWQREMDTEDTAGIHCIRKQEVVFVGDLKTVHGASYPNAWLFHEFGRGEVFGDDAIFAFGSVWRDTFVQAVNVAIEIGSENRDVDMARKFDRWGNPQHFPARIGDKRIAVREVVDAETGDRMRDEVWWIAKSPNHQPSGCYYHKWGTLHGDTTQQTRTNRDYLNRTRAKRLLDEDGWQHDSKADVFAEAADD